MAYVFDLGNPATNANPFPEFARLRVEDPVHWSPAMKAWIVTRYADVKQVALNNRQISADRLTPFFKTNPEYQKGSIESLVRYLNHWMVFRDPPEHTRLRRLVNGAFKPPVIAALPERLLDRSLPAPGLIAAILVGKYCDHLPLYRQEQIFLSRHQVHLPRQTLARWVALAADWLKTHLRKHLHWRPGRWLRASG